LKISTQKSTMINRELRPESTVYNRQENHTVRGNDFPVNAVAGVPIVLLVMLRKRLTSKVESSCPKEDGLHLVAIAVDVMALTG